MRPGQAHRKAMLAHSLHRLRHYAGKDIDRAEYDAAVEAVQSARGIALNTPGHTAHVIRVRGRKLVAIWNSHYGCVRTFYPTTRWLIDKTLEPIGTKPK